MFPNPRREKQKNKLRTCCGPTHLSLNKIRRTVFIVKTYDLNINLNTTNKNKEILERKTISSVKAQATREQHVCMDNGLARK
jgi:hypothetical protein